MNIASLKNAATRSVGTGIFLTKKFSPQILTYVGIAGGITSAVLGAKATLKLEPVVDSLNNNKEIIHQNSLQITPRGEKLYPDAKRKKDLAYTWTKFSLDIAKLYGPTLAVGSVSIACIVAGQGIQQNRNAALLAGYTALDKAFTEYRRRTAEVVGEEQESIIRFDAEPTRIDDTAKGTVSEALTVGSPHAHSPYARFFDETCSSWERRADYNKVFLQGQEAMFNNMLIARGHVFLNEVYDALGMERTPAGSLVGWVVGPKSEGDGFIDFGIFKFNDERKRAFVNGLEDAILLDFNVDGVIYNKI